MSITEQYQAKSQRDARRRATYGTATRVTPFASVAMNSVRALTEAEIRENQKRVEEKMGLSHDLVLKLIANRVPTRRLVPFRSARLGLAVC